MAQQDTVDRLHELFRQSSEAFRENTRQQWSPRQYDIAKPRSFKKGGIVKKSGWAKVHKGEKIISAAKILGARRRKKQKRRKRNPLNP